jgi:hypothetical protein
MGTAVVCQVTIAKVLELVEAYGDVNMEICGDGILMDPLLRGGGWTEENVALSDQCSTMSTIHSAKYHACQELLVQIAALK